MSISPEMESGKAKRRRFSSEVVKELVSDASSYQSNNPVIEKLFNPRLVAQ